MNIYKYIRICCIGLCFITLMNSGLPLKAKEDTNQISDDSAILIESFIAAAENGNFDLVRDIATRNPTVVNASSTAKNGTALEGAILGKHDAVVVWLIDHGANPFIRGQPQADFSLNFNLSPFIWCIVHDDPVRLRSLLRHKVQPLPDRFYGALFNRICSRPGDPSPVLKVLIDDGMSPEVEYGSGNECWANAVAGNKYAAVKFLILNGLSSNVRTEDGWTPLLYAISPYDTDVDVEARFDFVHFLLSHGADPNRGTKDRIPILFAVKSRDQRLVKLLLQFGAQLQPPNSNKAPDLYQYSALEAAICNQDLAMVKLLIREGASPNWEGPSGQSGLFYSIMCSDYAHTFSSVSQKNSDQIVKYLIESGGNVNHIAVSEQLSPLELVLLDHSQFLPLCLEHGGDLRRKETRRDGTLLEFALESEDVDIRQFAYAHLQIVPTNWIWVMGWIVINLIFIIWVRRQARRTVKNESPQFQDHPWLQNAAVYRTDWTTDAVDVDDSEWAEIRKLQCQIQTCTVWLWVPSMAWISYLFIHCFDPLFQLSITHMYGWPIAVLIGQIMIQIWPPQLNSLSHRLRSAIAVGIAVGMVFLIWRWDRSYVNILDQFTMIWIGLAMGLTGFLTPLMCWRISKQLIQLRNFRTRIQARSPAQSHPTSDNETTLPEPTANWDKAQ